jgi:predicted dehydrogenase
MYNICIIGAGQLGSRHLQGVLKTKHPMRVFVVDPVQTSVETAKSRANEVQHSHELIFCSAISELPKHLDIVIVATNSNGREQIVIDLIQNHDFDYLVLEKVLFQEIEAYHRVEQLLSKTNSKVFVNHPRRMFDSYLNFKEILRDIGPVSIQVSGGDWGLACNSLHFLDLFEFLLDQQVSYIDTQYLNQTPKPSKRSGFIEFTGTLSGQLTGGSSFQITSFEGDPTPISLLISGNKKRYLIQEAVSSGIFELPLDKTNQIVHPFQFEYQSNMTTKVIDSLIETETCFLTAYSEASRLHTLFISELLKVYNSNSSVESQKLPIT